MEQQSKKQELPKPIEIGLNQEFYPFAGSNVKEWFRGEEDLLESYKSYMGKVKDEEKLMVGGSIRGLIDSMRHSKKPFEFSYENTAFIKLPSQVISQPLEIGVCLRPVEDDGLGIFPFSKEEGYIIDNEDSNLDTRRTKIKKRTETRAEFLSNLAMDNKDDALSPIAPHLLVIKITRESLQRAGLVDIDANNQISISPKGESLLNSIQCIVGANGLYISKGDIRLLLEGSDFHFNSFSPIDAKLAAETHSTMYYEHSGEVDVGEGHELFFPAKDEERKQIGVRFTLDTALSEANP